MAQISKIGALCSRCRTQPVERHVHSFRPKVLPLYTIIIHHAWCTASSHQAHTTGRPAAERQRVQIPLDKRLYQISETSIPIRIASHLDRMKTSASIHFEPWRAQIDICSVLHTQGLQPYLPAATEGLHALNHARADHGRSGGALPPYLWASGMAAQWGGAWRPPPATCHARSATVSTRLSHPTTHLLSRTRARTRET